MHDKNNFNSHAATFNEDRQPRNTGAEHEENFRQEPKRVAGGKRWYQRDKLDHQL